MYHILRHDDQPKGAASNIAFEGQSSGAGVSFFLVELEPGKGPRLHKHPYPETWIVQSGQAAMTVDGEEVIASSGDIVVVGPETPHRFIAIGGDRLVIVCIHAADRFINQWLD